MSVCCLGREGEEGRDDRTDVRVLPSRAEMIVATSEPVVGFGGRVTEPVVHSPRLLLHTDHLRALSTCNRATL